jgi:hypothetical protein
MRGDVVGLGRLFLVSRRRDMSSAWRGGVVGLGVSVSLKS